MLDILSKLLLTKQLKFGSDKITLLNESIVMSPLTTYVGVQKTLEKKKMENILYHGAKETGISWNKKMIKIYKTKTIRQIFDWGNKVMKIAGWGEFKVHSEDIDKKEFIYRLYNSQMAKSYGKSKKPVCQIPRGYFAGSACFLTKTDLDAVESKCISKGNAYCEFVIQEKKKFGKIAIAKQQLS